MNKVSREVLEECANNLMFKMSEEELSNTLEEFDNILSQMSYLGAIEGIDNETPLTFPNLEESSFLREDEPIQPDAPSEALKNVPSRLGNQVKLPKVVG